jgi:hypothetical protein
MPGWVGCGVAIPLSGPVVVVSLVDVTISGQTYCPSLRSKLQSGGMTPATCVVNVRGVVGLGGDGTGINDGRSMVLDASKVGVDFKEGTAEEEGASNEVGLGIAVERGLSATSTQ